MIKKGSSRNVSVLPTYQNEHNGLDLTVIILTIIIYTTLLMIRWEYLNGDYLHKVVGVNGFYLITRFLNNK